MYYKPTTIFTSSYPGYVKSKCTTNGPQFYFQLSKIQLNRVHENEVRLYLALLCIVGFFFFALIIYNITINYIYIIYKYNFLILW